MAGNQVDFANAREVRRALRNLEVDFVKFPVYFQKRWIRNALKASVKASGLLNKYQAAAPIDSGNLKKSATIVNGNLRSGPQKGNPYAAFMFMSMRRSARRTIAGGTGAKRPREARLRLDSVITCSRN